MPERRSPGVQEPRVDGRRDTDPRLTTRDCADRLGVTPGFVLGEIKAGRLEAVAYRRGGLRAVYRVSPAALASYRRQYGWTSCQAS